MRKEITTDTLVTHYPAREDILYFLIKTNSPDRTAYIIRKKDAPLSASTRGFISALLAAKEALR